MFSSQHLSRKALRSELRTARRGLTDAEQRDAAQRIVQRLTSLPQIQNAQNIASYLSNDGELDLSHVHDWCWQQNKTVHLPVLHPFAKQHLLMLAYSPATPMTLNHFGISEPALNSTLVCPLSKLDVILLPLVGFDKHANRLGMGGGFYDRSLAPYRDSDTRPLLIGIAHDCQQVDALPTESWDIPLDGIVTPSQIIMLSIES